ncbi:MAG: hypothetical protein H0T46_09090 [Deltaproteobacteria bacterium]|nr:hypothetical protein [Deltaproteobacteria bacterium]
MAEAWMKCTECRTEIPYDVVYWQCSVSTCNRSRMPLYFCSVVCWDSHLSVVRHRDAYAVEVRAPSKESWQKEQADAAAAPQPRAMMVTPDRPLASGSPSGNPAPRPMPQASPPAQVTTRKVVGEAAPGDASLADVADKDQLIVISKLKKYIKDRSGMNCSDAVADMLSDHVRAVCDEAIRAAARDERKTVLDRDVPKTRR